MDAAEQTELVLRARAGDAEAFAVLADALGDSETIPLCRDWAAPYMTDRR